jgi:hypothetical protein
MDRKDEVFESASVVVESSISMSELSSPLGAFRVTASAISIDSSGVTSRMKKVYLFIDRDTHVHGSVGSRYVEG